MVWSGSTDDDGYGDGDDGRLAGSDQLEVAEQRIGTQSNALANSRQKLLEQDALIRRLTAPPIPYATVLQVTSLGNVTVAEPEAFQPGAQVRVLSSPDYPHFIGRTGEILDEFDDGYVRVKFAESVFDVGAFSVGHQGFQEQGRVGGHTEASAGGDRRVDASTLQRKRNQRLQRPAGGTAQGHTLGRFAALRTGDEGHSFRPGAGVLRRFEKKTE